MPEADVSGDHLVLLQIEGLHCHRCEATIQRVLSRLPGVREVEVDFPSGQASVLVDGHAVKAGQMMSMIDDAGYRAVSYIEKQLPREGPAQPSAT